MSTQPNKKDRQKKDRRGSRRGGGSRQTQASSRTRNYPRPSCGLCGEPIKDITAALVKPDDETPVHFDCALKMVEKHLNPGEGEVVIYLGNGNFAAVDDAEYRKRRLKILRRSDYWASIESVPSWRLELRNV